VKKEQDAFRALVKADPQQIEEKHREPPPYISIINLIFRTIFSGQGWDSLPPPFKIYHSTLMRTDLPIHLTECASYSLQLKRTANASRKLTNSLGLYVWTSQSWTFPCNLGNIHGNEIKHLFHMHKTNVQPLQQTILYIQNTVRMKIFIHQKRKIITRTGFRWNGEEHYRNTL